MSEDILIVLLKALRALEVTAAESANGSRTAATIRAEAKRAIPSRNPAGKPRGDLAELINPGEPS